MCEEREKLLDYLYDACGPEERRSVEAHLEECAGCRDEISSLRAVRLDLLAWNVPDHGSVWRPFAPARPTPWYREVPAWAMAIAASLVFLVGFGGGMLARHLAPRQEVAATQAAPSLVPQLAAAPTRADIAAMEKRILATTQAQIDQRLQPIAAHVRASSGASKDDVMQEVQRLLASSEERQRQALATSMRTLLQDSEKTFVRRTKFDSFVNRELDPLMRWEITQAMQQGGR
jgi:hypothetical protein